MKQQGGVKRDDGRYEDSVKKDSKRRRSRRERRTDKKRLASSLVISYGRRRNRGARGQQHLARMSLLRPSKTPRFRRKRPRRADDGGEGGDQWGGSIYLGQCPKRAGGQAPSAQSENNSEGGRIGKVVVVQCC